MRKRSTRKGGRAFVGPPINYGNTSTWGTTNYYKDNLNPKIFFRTPNHYNVKGGRKSGRKTRKYRGGLFDDSRRLFQPLTNAWNGMRYSMTSSSLASAGSYPQPNLNPDPTKQFYK